jgi:hypothetical protein
VITARVANKVAKHRAVVESSLENLSHAEIDVAAKGDSIGFHAGVRNAIGSGNGAVTRKGMGVGISSAADFIQSRGGLAG